MGGEEKYNDNNNKAEEGSTVDIDDAALDDAAPREQGSTTSTGTTKKRKNRSIEDAEELLSKERQLLEEMNKKFRQLQEENERLRNQQHSARNADENFAGGNVATNGKGSRTTSGDLMKTIKENNLTKGAALTHLFYRHFLRSLKDGAVFCQEKSAFIESLEEKWKTTSNQNNIGVTRKQNSSGQIASVPEPVATSILSALTQSFIACVYSATATFSGMPLWLSEVEMKAKILANNDSGLEEDKKPRADGVLCGEDCSGSTQGIVGMRGFLCNENKIGRISENGFLEGFGNTIDVIAQKPKKCPMWPTMSMFTSFENDGKISFQMHAFIPDKSDDTKVCEAQIWNGDGIQSYFASIYALCKAWDKFREGLKQGNTPEFGFFYRNMAFCKQEQKYYKAFWKSSRQPNLCLVKKYIDPEAELVQDGEGKNLFLEMKKKGSALDTARTSDQTVSASAFSCIANGLRQLHEEDQFVHGDIRLANLLFDKGEGSICDFDLSGKEGEKYPPSFNVKINDGKRHNDAEPNKPMEMEHDWHALASVMDLFTVGEEHKNAWGRAVNSVQKGEVPSCLDFNIILEKQDGASALKGTEKPPADIPNATGSPYKLDGERRNKRVRQK